MLTKRESLEETRLPLKINLYVTIWTSAILAERLLWEVLASSNQGNMIEKLLTGSPQQ